MSYRLASLSVLLQTDPAAAKRELVAVLREKEGDISRTAEALGVSRQCVYNWMGRLDIKLGSHR